MGVSSYQPAVAAAKKALKEIRSEITDLNKALTTATKLLTDYANKKTPSTVEDSLKKQVEGLQKVIEKQKELSIVKQKEFAEIQRLATFVNKMQIEDEQRSAKKIALSKKESKAREAQVKKESEFSQRMVAQRKKEELAAKRVATSNEHLNRSYVKLSTRLKAARDKLQDLISTEKSAIKNQDAHNKKIRQAQKEYNALAKKANQAKKAVSNFKNTGLGGLVRSVGSLVSAFGILGGAALFASMTKSVFTLTKTLDSLRFSMKAVITDEIELGQTERFLKQIAQDYGAELITVTNRYIKFRAASDQAGLSARQTQKIFGTMTKAAGVLGLKTDELQGIFLALEQMVSKGKITTEELRRQLGERLPGAMDIMANSLGVTTAELDKMLKKGEVITKDVLPGFAKQVEIAFGLDSFNKVTTLQAAVTRLKNKWTIIVEEFGKVNSVSDRLRKVFDFLADNLEKVLGVMIKVIKAFVLYKVVVVGLTAIVRGYEIVVATLSVTKRILAKSTNLATAAMKAFNLATKTTPAGVIIAIIAAVAAAFVLFKDNVSDAEKELQDFNDEVERLDTFGGKVAKSMDNIANGTLRAGTATGKLFVIYDTLNDVLEKETKHIKNANDRLAFKNELIEKITNQRGLDAKAAKKFADEEFSGFSKITRKRIAEAVIGANELNTIIDESNKFQEGEDKKKVELDAKAAEKARKSIFTLEKFRIEQNILANEAIANNEGNAEQERIDAMSEAMDQRRELARLAADFAQGDPKANNADKLLAEENFIAEVIKINRKGNEERDKVIDDGAKNALDAWQQVQDDIAESDAIDIMKSDITKAMNELADDLGMTASDLFAEFNALYDWDYKNFIKFAKKKTKDSEDEGEKQKETLIENLERAGEFASELGNLGSTLFDASIQRYDDEIQKNNDFYTDLLDNALLSEEQRSALEAERDAKNAKIEKKKRAEERKQAILNKAAALVEIAINTAIAVTKVTAQTGVLAFLSSIPAVIALGAIQAAAVLATPIPKFAKGKGEYDNYEGWGIWGEKRREAKISKDGSVEISPKTIGNHPTYVKKDDVIHPNADNLIQQMSMADIDMKPYLFTQPDNMSAYLMMGDLFNDRTDSQTNKMVDAINKKKMSFKLNQTINLAEDIAFLLDKKDTL